MAITVGLRLINIESVVGVLATGDAVPHAIELGDQPCGQLSFASILPTSNAEYVVEVLTRHVVCLL